MTDNSTCHGKCHSAKLPAGTNPWKKCIIPSLGTNKYPTKAWEKALIMLDEVLLHMDVGREH